MNHSVRALSLLALLYIVSIGASESSLDERNLEDRTNNDNWDYTVYTPNALRHGIQGPAVSPTKVTIGSVVGQTIYQFDLNKGDFSILVQQPNGEADDEVFGPDGTLVWTGILSGLVRSRTTDGKIRVVGNSSFPNGVAFDSRGNCYFSQFPVGNGIYKINPKGSIADQKLVYNTRLPMNGFDFSSADEIFGPYPFSGEVVKINLQTKTETVIASGFLDPEAVRFSADKKTLYVLDIGAQAVYSVNIRNGAKTLVVKVDGLVYLDNFRPLGNGLLIADTTSNSPIYYSFSSKSYQYTTPKSVFNMPGGLSISNGKLYIADFTAQKVYNIRSKSLTTIARSGYQGDTSPANTAVSYGLYNSFVKNGGKKLALSCFYDGKVQVRDVNSFAVLADNIPAGAPYGLAWSSDEKTLFIADFFTGLRVNTGSTLLTSKIITPGGDNLIIGVALSINKANTVYVSSYSGKLYTVNYVTGAYTVLTSGLNAPEGITVVSSKGQDVVIVANTGAKTLLTVSSNGTKKVIASNLPVGLAGVATLPPPNIFTGVAADEYNAYVTSDLSDAVITVRHN